MLRCPSSDEKILATSNLTRSYIKLDKELQGYNPLQANVQGLQGAIDGVVGAFVLYATNPTELLNGVTPYKERAVYMLELGVNRLHASLVNGLVQDEYFGFVNESKNNFAYILSQVRAGSGA